MHNGGARKNGGIGLALTEPRGILHITESDNIGFEDHRENPLAESEMEELLGIMESVSVKFALGTRVHVVLDGNLQTHVGMGSGTAIRLGVLEGLFCINQRTMSRKELIQESNRGGTSGIGINTYFSGGLVLDLGVQNNDDVFLPSSQATSPSVPLSFPSVPVPDWSLCLCIPQFIPPKSREEERDFFVRTTPIVAMDSFRASYEAIFGVYAAVVEGNFSAFCRSIRGLQETRWKKQEWSEYGWELHEITIRLQELGAEVVGMSSLGPMLYCFGAGLALERIGRKAMALNCEIIVTRPYNFGREIAWG